MSWESSTIKYSNDEIRIGHFTNHHMGKYFNDDQIGTKLAANFNLYNYILRNLNKPNAYLATAITVKGKPVFSVKDVQNIKVKIKAHQDNPYSKKLLGAQSGGTASAAATAAVANATAATAAKKGPVVDESRNRFWDKMIRRITDPLSARIDPNGWTHYLIWWTQILYHLEQMDLYGPFISQALDTVTLSLPVVAEIASEMAGKMFQLAPIPYASFAGDAIGYAISLVFVLTAVTINGSRRHFGSAFKTSLDAIPLIGESLSTAAINFETGAERFSGYKKKLVGSVDKISPTASNIIYSYVPDTETHTEPLPPLNTDKIAADFEKYAEKKSGLDKLQAIADKATNIGTMANATVGSVSNKATAAANAAIGSATAAVGNKVGGRRTRRMRRK